MIMVNLRLEAIQIPANEPLGLLAIKGNMNNQSGYVLQNK